MIKGNDLDTKAIILLRIFSLDLIIEKDIIMTCSIDIWFFILEKGIFIFNREILIENILVIYNNKFMFIYKRLSFINF